MFHTVSQKSCDTGWKTSKKFTVPYVPAIFQLAVACIMMSLGSFDFLTDMLIFVMWLFSLLIFIGVFILRKKDTDKNQ